MCRGTIVVHIQMHVLALFYKAAQSQSTPYAKGGPQPYPYINPRPPSPPHIPLPLLSLPSQTVHPMHVDGNRCAYATML